MKEIKDDTDCWQDIPRFWIAGINIVNMTTLLKAIYRLSAIPIKLPTVYFSAPERILSQFVWKHKRP